MTWHGFRPKGFLGKSQMAIRQHTLLKPLWLQREEPGTVKVEPRHLWEGHDIAMCVVNQVLSGTCLG